jgi:hypothetical protein
MGCAECGTDHSDHFPGSIGEKMACLDAQGEAFRGAARWYLRRQSRKAHRKLDAGRDAALRSYFGRWPPR